jgi:predicted metal-dependent enzyme (double-stranded beta helix superfamily)
METYLRITLGNNNGESPGIPYVMEIWPKGHFSPVHSHSDAEAIIRVLEGGIHVDLFPFLSAGIKPFTSGDFVKGDVMWISPTLNQTHQLKNIGAATCITIQCYMYNEKDDKHYDYFDYLDDKGTVQQYEPDSDMDFIDFKNLMLEEWAMKPRCCKN